MYLKMSMALMIVLAMISLGAKGCEIHVTPPVNDGDDTDIVDTLPIDTEQCDDLAGIYFGACEMWMGWAVVDGICQGMSGCGAQGHVFFETREECEFDCLGAPDPDPGICDDLAGIYFGACEMWMGWAVVDGICQGMSGCGAKGHVFFETREECESDCLGAPDPNPVVCDDGSVTLCKIAKPDCDESEVLGIVDGCYECVNPATCQPWGTPQCAVDDDCGPGERCDGCASSSCPFCDDCVAACVPDPQSPGCETDDDCQLVENYCGGCNCWAVPIGATIADCPPEEEVQCFAPACHIYETAVCNADGECEPQ